MKKYICVFITLIILFAFAAPALAETDEDAVIDPNRLCSIIIDYMEDTEGTDPVVNAGFTAYKAASLSAYGGFEYLPGLQPDKDGEPDVRQMLQTIKTMCEENPGHIITSNASTGINGQAVFSSLESGLYIIEETEPAPDHFASLPLIVQIPYTEDGQWEYSCTVSPKPEPAGKLRILKTVRSTRGDPDQEFHFSIWLEGITGMIHYTKSDMDGYMLNGECVALKDGESVLLDMIPVGTEYRVEEIEADQGEYLTTFSGKVGHIKRTEISIAHFINTQVPPPTGDVPTEYIAGGISLLSLAMACVLIFRIRRI